ncbi:MAG: universal stress protein [Betaproteobacteria bacterium]|nr:universal stress protein [Betaproteobacteria bacterium]
MYKRILVSTDGSKLSLKAIKTATRLAKSLGAAVTGVYVMPEYVPPVYGEAAIYMPEMSPKKFKEATAKEAAAALAVVAADAQKAGVTFAGVSVTDAQPWQAIVRTAKGKKCDLIVMASHGRRGLSGLLLGSETTKVLTHSKIPVLVCR